MHLYAHVEVHLYRDWYNNLHQREASRPLSPCSGSLLSPAPFMHSEPLCSPGPPSLMITLRSLFSFTPSPAKPWNLGLHPLGQSPGLPLPRDLVWASTFSALPLGLQPRLALHRPSRPPPCLPPPGAQSDQMWAPGSAPPPPPCPAPFPAPSLPI